MVAVLLVTLILLAIGFARLRLITGKAHFNQPLLSVSTETNSAAELWNSTQIATVDKETGVLIAKLPDVGLVEFLAVGGFPTNANNIWIPADANNIWRADGRPMTNVLAEFGNLRGFDHITIGGKYEAQVGSLQYRSLLFRVANSVDNRIKFEPDSAHLFSRHSVRGLEWTTLAFPISAHTVKMRLGCASGPWRPISTLDAHGKVYNHPRRAGDPDFNVDWDESFDGDGNASVKVEEEMRALFSAFAK